MEKVRDEQYNRIKRFLCEIEPFTDNIPDIPRMETPEDYQEYVVKNFIRCGAIPKKDLVTGKTYIGNCRNTNEATWDGIQFIYDRTKYGVVFKDRINHFEDDNGYDLFVPIKEK